MNELSDLIRKQQQLRDRTFKQGQDSRRDRMRGQRGDQNATNDLQRDQQGLRDRLQKLLDQLAKQGMMPKGGKGDQQGDQNADQDQAGQGDQDNALGDADQAMGDAGDKLGDGDADNAVDSQARALDSMRRGAQQLGQQMQSGAEQMGPGNMAGRQGRARALTDPLGRPLHDGTDDTDPSVDISGGGVQRAQRVLEELRRRLGESQRPQVELDYIERLLKEY